MPYVFNFFFFFNDTATTEIYTLSLHDALPICGGCGRRAAAPCAGRRPAAASAGQRGSVPKGTTSRTPRYLLATDRKSTRLNSSHDQISYAVFCLKKIKTNNRFTFRAVSRRQMN